MMSSREQMATLERPGLAQPESVPLQTFRRSFAQICNGEDPWVPLGNFMHQFFGEYKAYREKLLSDPIDLPDHLTPEQQRWAVFCAASIEYLAQKYSLVCPEWVFDSHYNRLPEPWYYDINAELPEVQEELRQTTPEEFTRRNIFCGDRTYRNKYEYTGRHGRRHRAA